MPGTKPSLTLRILNNVILVITLWLCLLTVTLPYKASEFARIFREMAIDLPVFTELFFAIPAWLYFIVASVIFVALIVKEFSASFKLKFVTNIIAFVGMGCFYALYFVAMMMPVVGIQQTVMRNAVK